MSDISNNRDEYNWNIAKIAEAFTLYNGQAFFNTAFFRAASIDFARRNENIRSGGYVAGKVTATSGSFRGVVAAESFVGDVVNAGTGLDKSKMGAGGVTTRLTYRDTTGTSKPRTVIVSAVVMIYGSTRGDATARFSVIIDGTTKEYQWVTCSTRNTTNAVAAPVIFAKSGITKQVVTASISVNDCFQYNTFKTLNV